MNDYLESKHDILQQYYQYLLVLLLFLSLFQKSALSSHNSLLVPEKFYDGSLQVLCYAFHKASTGEWVPEEECYY